MKSDEIKDFFAENEKNINVTIGKILTVCLFGGPFMIALRFFNIFPDISYKFLISFVAITSAIVIFIHLINRKDPYNRYIKYIFVISLELSVFSISIFPKTAVFISYLIAPIISCIYFDTRFTLRTCIACWVTLIVSLVIRSKTNVTGDPTNVGQYLLAYIAGNSLEYIICSVLLLNITNAFRTLLTNLNSQNKKVLSIQERLIVGIANLVESKDVTTAQHVERTSEYVKKIAYALIDLGYYKEELTEKNILLMIKTAPLHDIGKMYIPESILKKQGPLTVDERHLIQMHPLFGEKIIMKDFSAIENEEFTQMAVFMALCHHEWWNGNGYPLHLVGDEIPLAARIMAAADVMDALLSERPYKKPFTLEETLKIMQQSSGTQFDPKVIEAVILIKNNL